MTRRDETAETSVPAEVAPDTQEPQKTEMPKEPMPAAEHWSKAVDFIVRSIAGARNAATLQRAASAQLDATTYALEGLYEELQAAMPVPGSAQEEAPASVIVRMTPRPKRRVFPNVFGEKVRKARKAPKSRKAPKTRRTRKAA